jgi:MoaA/NifB/PqqE/SkfB family radical SAM enzyme
MLVYLTNTGHKYISALLASKSKEILLQNKESRLLLSILEQIVYKTKDSILINELYKKGFIQVKSDELNIQDVKLLYKRNPLEHVQSLVFEFTTACNFDCMHCRILKTNPVTETNIENLKKTADIIINLGIKKFVFIGGEVSKYGNGWLELAKHINRDSSLVVGILSNGWWLGETDFSAAGRTYSNDLSYLSDLKQNGVSHMLFSIDGEEKYHDKWRKHSGLFERIIDGLEKVKNAGLKPRISVVVKDNITPTFVKNLAEIAERIYSLPKNITDQAKLMLLSADETNIFSNFIDIGNGTNLRTSKSKISEIPTKDLRCKAFYRPAPNLRINANGEFAVCPLLSAGEGFGNIHHKPITRILNNMQDSFVYKLHSERLINNYLKYWDESLLGNSYEHLCSVRAFLTILAKKMYYEGFDTSSTKTKVEQLIKESAEECGFNYG